MNLSCSPQVRRRLRLPCFYGRPFPVLYRLFVPARHAKKWPKSTRQPKVRRPLGILLIPVKWQKSNSSSKCPITEPKNRTWSLLLSHISYHTHDLQIRGRSSRYGEAVTIAWILDNTGWKQKYVFKQKLHVQTEKECCLSRSETTT